MSGLFGGGAPKMPKVAPAPAPKQMDEAENNAARAMLMRRRSVYGKDDTMITGALGAAPVARKSLLGV